MDWITAQLFAILIGVGLTVIDKFIVGHVNVNAYMLLIGTVGLLSLLLFPVVDAPMLSRAEWFYGIVLGIAFCFAIYFTFRAFQKDEVSRIAPLSIMSTILISVGAAIFFDERLTTQQYWAFGLFALGAFTLATRIDKKMVLLYDLTNFRIMKVGKTLTYETQRAVYNPVHATRRLHREVVRNMKYSVAVWEALWGNILEYTPWNTGVVKQKTRLKLIKGLGWFLLSVAITIPFTLLLKEYNTSVGVVSGFIAVRVGLFVGSVLLALGRWHDIVVFFRQRKIFALASVKELFGMTSNFLAFFAAASGPLAVVQSMGAIGSVGVFIVASVMARFGLIQESLKKRDLVQKSFGVVCIAIATVLLFI